MVISISDWNAIDYRLDVVLPMPYGLALSGKPIYQLGNMRSLGI